MARPVNQGFDSLTGTLGNGSVTIFGITFYTDDPNSTISVTADHHLNFAFALPGFHVFGYRSADGSNFNPLDIINPGLQSFSVFSTGRYTVTEYRDGAAVAGTTITNNAPSRYDISDVTAQSHNIDQVQFSFAGTSATIDDLQFSAPLPASNAAPTISNLSGSVTYTERSAPVALDSGFDALVSDGDSANFAGGALTVVFSGARGEDNFGIATGPGGVTLSSGMAAGSTVFVQGTSIGTIRSGATGIAGQSLAIDLNGNANAANVSTLLHTLTYTDSATPDPAADTRTVRITLSDGDNGSGDAVLVVNVVGVNDAPTVLARATNPTFTEDGNAVALFTNASVSTQEGGQQIDHLTLTVSNVRDGALEILHVDGSAVPLVEGSVRTSHGATAVVSPVVNGLATVTLSQAGGFSSANLAAIVNGISYEDASDTPTTSASRVVTLTSVSDTGGTSNGGVDTTALSISSVVSIQAVNDAPVITSGGYIAQASVAENATFVKTVMVSDVDGPGPFSYTLDFADADLFSIDSDGNLSFKTAPDYEHPGSSAGTNDYAVFVHVSDNGGGTTVQKLTVHVTDLNDTAPVITSGGSASEAENSAIGHVVYQTAVTDPDTVGTIAYSLSGADAALFSISVTGAVTFKASPDFEIPADQNHDNVYDLVVSASDGANPVATQAVAVTVTNVADPDTLTLHITQDAYQGDAQFLVLVDGVQAGGTQTAHAAHGSGAPNTVTLYGDFGDADRVSVQFVNDAFAGSSGQDRNLYVEDVTLNGERQSGSAAAVSPNVGFARGDGSVVLATNGAAVFNFGGSGPDTLVFHVSENAYQGDAQFVVLVDGHQIGGTQTAYATHGSGAPDAITLHGSFGAGTHDVAFRFVNDVYGGSTATDRNLYVDDVSLNGHLQQGSEATVSPSVGSAQGSSVILATNGDALFHFDLHA